LLYWPPPRPAEVQIDKSLAQTIGIDLVGPSVGVKHRSVKTLMLLSKPGRPRIVQVGQSPGAEFLFRQTRRVQPALAKSIEI
jgi:hypothetical protein